MGSWRRRDNRRYSNTLTREGIPTGVISVPARYIHTPVEVIDKRDLEKTVELFYNCIKEVNNFF